MSPATASCLLPDCVRGLHLLDKTTGATLEVVTEFVDLVDPKSTGVVAFTVRASLLVPLRRVGWKNAADESHFAGEIYGRKAEPNDARGRDLLMVRRGNPESSPSATGTPTRVRSGL